MPDPTVLRIATRNSPLAQIQAHWVGHKLMAQHPQLNYVLVPIITEADTHEKSLSTQGGKGVFVKAIQKAVLEGRADLTVHSAKDMPSIDTPGLTLCCVPERGPCHDVLATMDAHDTLATLPAGARIGTSSPRRAFLIEQYHPTLKVLPIRGNIQTRLDRLKTQQFDGLILAAAGLMRLSISANI